jgi:hypothetical protein
MVKEQLRGEAKICRWRRFRRHPFFSEEGFADYQVEGGNA